MKTIGLLVSGKVQGVFFRLNTKKIAGRLGLKGYAKNLDNGKVKVVVKGQENELNNFIDWLERGPRLAKVDNVEEIELSETEEFDDFEIR